MSRTIAKRSENRLFGSGTVLAKPVTVNRKFTYRELTLVLGVFVAMIVAIMVWSSKKNTSDLPPDTSVSSALIETPLQKFIIRSVTFVTSVEF